MILLQLIRHHLRHRDDSVFYELQARDAIRWLEWHGVQLGADRTVLDLGCGHGVFGRECLKHGCRVTFADATRSLLPDLGQVQFEQVDLDRDGLRGLGSYDLVICSNVLEHLAQPGRFLETIQESLGPGGHFYLSWTNWWSPWGGHEFSPFHFLGPRLGPRCYDRWVGKPRIHTPYVNLFPTYVGRVIRAVRRNRAIECVAAAPRYYPELAFVLRIPGLREFLTWNCALLLRLRATSKKD